MPHVLITGGAGFVGGHLAERLLREGCRVRLLDNFSPQVHGDQGPAALPASLRRDCELRRGDVTSPTALDRALAGIDAVVHCAATVGVGQSMYRIADYCRNNVLGTAELLQAILRRRQRPRGGMVERIVVASSMSIYGEGRYLCPACAPDCGPLEVPPRPRSQLERRKWEPLCPCCGGILAAQPTDETKAPDPQSIYAVTKLTQEQMVLNFARAYGLPAMALRFFNIYGPRQALANPYTGVVAILAARLRAGLPVTLFEDGEQRRDFVSVHDVAAACVAALGGDGGSGVYNIASGEAITIRRLAEMVAETLGAPLELATLGRYRIGDIRHCTAEIGRARRELHFRPQIGLRAGLRELAAWLDSQKPLPRTAGLAIANQELRAFGLGG